MELSSKQKQVLTRGDGMSLHDAAVAMLIQCALNLE